ncbi:energy coupling factor transporter S component ThiW [Halobacillus karajensis]|uniref:ThiW protein n=1 Tax=Halobacillus karajensis TaxID=195088 RepID=A0A059NX74_9BACI|nr:energy coupling factor transporter S component ThiW [Halobacillus karajensis]CDQ18615.1 thiW protein [Halobacillus karajensis]CDQ23313.1 thiW protein [Halobacillus karajensis]CDQ26795.1 thiW protein [Halobacillus karajensis]SEH49126.1 energy coupling factor transporter S component ThiW [Halobacillus karajensis]
MKGTRLLTMMAVLVAIGTLGAQFLWFPAGIAKAYPVQHAVNVIAAVMLGPVPAVIIAFVVGLLRLLLGLGTFLAFPGGMFGALLAGICYQLFEKKRSAVVGETIGTGIIGSLASIPIANLLMGSTAGVFAFAPSFIISSVSGALIAVFILSRVKIEKMVLQP